MLSTASMLTVERKATGRLRPYSRLLGAYHIVFGTAGLVAVLELSIGFVRQAPQSAVQTIVLLLVMMAIAFMSVLGVGVALLQERRYAWAFALLVQLTQVPMWNLDGSSYSFVAGLYGGFTYESSRVSPFGGAMANLHLGWESNVAQAAIGINVLPLLVALLVWRFRVRRMDVASS